MICNSYEIPDKFDSVVTSKVSITSEGTPPLVVSAVCFWNRIFDTVDGKEACVAMSLEMSLLAAPRRLMITRQHKMLCIDRVNLEGTNELVNGTRSRRWVTSRVQCVQKLYLGINADQ